MEHIDLHTHSTASDGTDSPSRLVEKAREASVAALALTDHDTLSGLDEAEEAARDNGIYFVRGCEVSSSTEHGEMHILGLWIPRGCDQLEKFLWHLRENRRNRNAAILEKLGALGINIGMEELDSVARGTPGRPHIAKLMLAHGHVASRKEAFDKYLGINGLAYVPKIAPRPEQAARLLASLGATVSIAHPLLRPAPAGWLEGMARNLAGTGLSALEAWHSSHTRGQMLEIASLAQVLGLGLTGGSDYHGKSKPGIHLGVTGDNLLVPYDVLEKLQEQRKKNGLPIQE